MTPSPSCSPRFIPSSRFWASPPSTAMSKSRAARIIRYAPLTSSAAATFPSMKGLARPIVRSDFPTPRAVKRDAKVHLAVLPFPEARAIKQRLSAPEYLVHTFADQPGEIVLVAVGPLSNLAAAIALDPAFPGHVAELVIMGGAIDKSNVTPSAEFNIWADPEAAAVVMAAAFAKITLVPLDATHQALI